MTGDQQLILAWTQKFNSEARKRYLQSRIALTHSWVITEETGAQMKAMMDARRAKLEEELKGVEDA